MEGTLIQSLMSIFPILKTMDGEQRTIQLGLIEKNFNIVYYKNEGMSAGNHKCLLDGSTNPYYFGRDGEGPTQSTYVVVRYDNVVLRGRKKVVLDSQYVRITRNLDRGGMPFLTMYENTFESSGGRIGKNWNGREDDCWDTPLHPHISRHEPCLGSFENMLYKDAKVNPLSYFTLLGKFYRTWNVDSCFWNINHMEPLLANVNEENSDILLSALEFTRIKNCIGRPTHLRELIPYFIKEKIALVDCIQPLNMLSLLRDEWTGMFKYEARNQIRRIIPEWKDSCWEVYRILEHLDSDNYCMYKQQIGDIDERRILRDQLVAMRKRYEEGFSDKLLAKFNDTMVKDLGSVLDAMRIPDSASNSDELVFNYALRESKDERWDFLMRNEVFYILSGKEMMSYFDEPMEYPSKSKYQTEIKNMDGTTTFVTQRFRPEDIISKLDHFRLECGQIAINKLNKQKDVIINDIKSLKDNTIENLVVQQQISF